jgi:transposase
VPKRYEFTQARWNKIENLIPGKVGDRDCTASDNRIFVRDVFWVLRSGAHWCRLPERYGNWKSVHKRLTRWARAGVWEELSQTTRTTRVPCHCGHSIYCKVRGEGERLGFLTFFDAEEVSETYGKQVACSRGCGAILDYRLLLQAVR